MADDREQVAVDIVARRMSYKAVVAGAVVVGSRAVADRMFEEAAKIDPTDEEFDAAWAYLEGRGLL